MNREKKIVLTIRQLRNRIFKRFPEVSVKDMLRYKCSAIGIVADKFSGGQLWDSNDLADPLFPKEKGHCLAVIPIEANRAVVVSLTGKKRIGHLDDMTSEEKVAEGLRKLTGAKKWKQINCRYFKM